MGHIKQGNFSSLSTGGMIPLKGDGIFVSFKSQN
jgi:hypothetical protein